MKVTKREQLLLGALLIVLLAYGYYNFVFAKQNKEISELKANKVTYSQKWEQAKAKIASKDKRKEQHIALSAKIVKETDKLFPSIEQEQIIVILDKMINDSNLKADVMDFSEISNNENLIDINKTANNKDTNKIASNEIDKLVSDFNEDVKKANNEKPNAAVTDQKDAIGAYKMQVSFKFKGTYGELTNFILLVENYDKNIIISNIELTGAQKSDILGTIILEFYGVPRLIGTDSLKWDYAKPAGNGSPFVGSSSSLQGSDEMIPDNPVSDPGREPINNPGYDKAGNNNGNSTVVKNEQSQNKSDFLMSAKLKAPNVHTVTIEKAKDQSKESFIYSDNEKIEEVEFYFTKVDGKYFYKYKTSLGTYPEDFNSYIEFVPNGEKIVLDIASQKRTSGSDLSGSNIKISNTTDKDLLVNILGDDKDNPRVKIIEKNGDIIVIQNYLYYSEK